MSFKTVRVSAVDDGFETLVLVLESGTEEGGVYQKNASWRCRLHSRK